MRIRLIGSMVCFGPVWFSAHFAVSVYGVPCPASSVCLCYKSSSYPILIAQAVQRAEAKAAVRLWLDIVMFTALTRRDATPIMNPCPGRAVRACPSPAIPPIRDVQHQEDR